LDEAFVHEDIGGEESSSKGGIAETGVGRRQLGGSVNQRKGRGPLLAKVEGTGEMTEGEEACTYV